MAIYKNGINGAFSGKIGAVVGVTSKGKSYMRALPSKRTGPVSEGEKASRDKFAKAHHWLKPVLPFVRAGFKGYSDTAEGFLAAKSYLLKNAFEHNGNSLVINPALVKVSHGDLPLPRDITAAKVGADKIQFTWDITDVNKDNAYDQVMLLAYDIENEVVYYHISGQLRMNGTDELTVGTVPFERTFHLYVAFVAADRSRQSDSVYLGTI